MSICVDGPVLEDFGATESINVWLSDSEPPSTPITLSLLFERLIFLFDLEKNIPHTNKCVCFVFILYSANATIFAPCSPRLPPVIVGQPGGYPW